MTNIPFDQYQRYKIAEIIINLYKDYYKIKQLKILEVGANEHKNLEKFLPSDEIYYLDIDLPDNLINDPKYILGDATNLLDIYDKEYDISIALDVYEHIPNKKRNDFLSELKRVSKYGVIICAPFNKSYVNEAEIRSNEYFKSLTGEDFIWLKEHIDEKLPYLDETNNMIINLNYSYINFGHGDIYLWEKLMKYHFFVSYYNDIERARELVDNFYNENIFYNDIGDKNYRTFITYSSDDKLLNFINDSLKNIFGYKDSIDDKILFLDYLINESKNTLSIKFIGDRYEKNLINKYEMVCYIKDNKNFEFNENYTIRKNIVSNVVYEVIAFDSYSGLKEIRIDPINSNCILTDIEIYSLVDGNRVDIEIIHSNADLKINNMLGFLSCDPQIYLGLDNKNINNLNVSYKLLDYDSDNVSKLINSLSESIKAVEKELEKLNNELVNFNKENVLLNNVISDKNIILSNYEERLRVQENELSAIKNSRGWKILTKIKRLIGK